MKSIDNLSGYIWVLLISIIATVISCANNQLAGSISETTNGRIAGIIVEQGGKFSGRAQVLLLPVNYDPLKDSIIAADTTDTLGFYTFSNLAKGEYSIFAAHLNKNSNTIIKGIHVEEHIGIVGTDTLRFPGSVKVMIPENADLKNGYIYIPGTTLYKSLNTISPFITLDSVPAEKQADIVYSVRSDSTVRVIRYSVQVNSHDSITVWNSLWKHYGNLVLNTSVTGTNTGSSVVNFPVLIRLNVTNFNFSQAAVDGADVRFTKKDNTFLSYEIERWDAVNLQAVIWVKVDTIRANDSIQSISMYWGNPDAKDSSNGPDVFDTTDNVTAVWHLGRENRDATANRNDAAAVSATDTMGIIGICKKFDGADSVTVSGLLGTPSDLTLSGWAQLDATDSVGGGEILSIGDAALIRMDNTRDSTGTSGMTHISGGSTFFEVNSRVYVKKTGWHFIAFTFNQTNSNYTLYIDGNKAGQRTDSGMAINYSGVGFNTYIGKHGNGKSHYGFYGRIDEVRVYRAAMNMDYIRLCYMNQKEDDALVCFR